MGAIVLDGEPVAARMRAEVADRVARLRTEGINVGLGTILVGDDLPSERYVALKHEDCAGIDMYSVGEHLPATATQQEVMDAIARFNVRRLARGRPMVTPRPMITAWRPSTGTS